MKKETPFIDNIPKEIANVVVNVIDVLIDDYSAATKIRPQLMNKSFFSTFQVYVNDVMPQVSKDVKDAFGFAVSECITASGIDLPMIRNVEEMSADNVRGMLWKRIEFLRDLKLRIKYTSAKPKTTEHKCQVLTMGEMIVDFSRLSEGAYLQTSGTIYAIPAESTLKDIELLFRKKKFEGMLYPESFFDNLNKCKLTKATLTLNFNE